MHSFAHMEMTKDTKLKAALVGLGRVGFAFDAEPGRTVIWTHAGAYAACAEDYELVAACDIDPARREAFARRFPGVRVFDDVRVLLRETAPDVLSLCTPAAGRAELVERILATSRLRALWCEKPLAGSYEAARGIVETCEARGVPVLAGYNRRFIPQWGRAKALIEAGALGRLRCLRIAIPNRLWSATSHGVDLALMLGGRAERVAALDVPALAEAGEPARPALIRFASGAYGIVEVTGLKANLMVEAEALGDEARMLVNEAQGTIELQRWVPSAAYEGYREPGEPAVETAASIRDQSPFVSAARELARLARDPAAPLSCSGRDALETERILSLMAAPAAAGLEQIA